MASPRGAPPEERRDGLLQEIFHVLDQKQRGFVSKVELSHILDAMQADVGRHRLPIPEGLSPRKILRDCRVNLQDMMGFLEELTVADLEDVKWFAESVVKVESELRDLWQEALRRWREDLLRLQSRDLHPYLLNSQPKAVSRWLQLREAQQTASPTNRESPRPGLGFTLHEVETLFAANTAEEINSYHQQMEPFLKALDLRRQLEFGGSNEQVKALLTQLQELAATRDLACLMIHEDTLGMACGCTKTAMTPSSPAPPMCTEVILEASKLIMTLLGHNLHQNCEHPKCESMLRSFLEIGYDPDVVEALVLQPLPRINSRDRTSISLGSRTSLLAGPPKPQTISTWVENLVTMETDLDRGDFVDKLIKYDEQRLLGAQDTVPESLFSHGRTIPVLLGRLNLSSTLNSHERRTPLRTHLLKFLLNILSSSGDRGRRLFRSAKGMQVLSSVLRGDSWGEPRNEGPDAEDEESSELPESEWRGLYHIKDLRFYPADFVDDKFYGPKDRVLAAAFLEYLGSEELWGDDSLMDEFLAGKGDVLQVLCRVNTCQNLLRVILRHRRFGELLESSASILAERFVEEKLRPLLSPSLPQLSVPFSFRGVSTPEHREALQAFHRAYMEAETKNSRMRILSFMYHHLESAQGVDQEDVEELSRLLAAHLPNEALPVAMAVFLAPQAAGEVTESRRTTESLYLLRLVQLYQLRSTVPKFVSDLEARLRSLCFEAPSSEALPLTAPLRPALVKRFPRSSPCELVQSLASLLREFAEGAKTTRQELQILAFSRLCFYMPPEKMSQDSPAALWAELGLSDRKLRKVQETLLQIPGHMLEAPFSGFSHPNCCLLHREGYVSLLQLTLDEQMFAFVHCAGSWMLWANSLDTSALTECSKVPKYFGV